MAKNVTGHNWIKARVERTLSPVVFEVRTEDNRLWKRHRDQLRSCLLSYETSERTPAPPVLSDDWILPETRTSVTKSTDTVPVSPVYLETRESPVLVPIDAEVHHESSVQIPLSTTSSSAESSEAPVLRKTPIVRNSPAKLPPAQLLSSDLRRSTRVRRAPDKLTL